MNFSCLLTMGYHLFSIVGAFFNQEKILVGAFSMIVKTDGSFAALQKVLIKSFYLNVCNETLRQVVGSRYVAALDTWSRMDQLTDLVTGYSQSSANPF